MNVGAGHRGNKCYDQTRRKAPRCPYVTLSLPPVMVSRRRDIRVGDREPERGIGRERIGDWEGEDMIYQVGEEGADRGREGIP